MDHRRIINRILSLALGLVVPFTTPHAVACPKVGRLVDFNCDGQFKISLTGDSLVRGRTDQAGLSGYGGQRLQDDFPRASIQNLGIPNITSGKLLEKFQRELLRSREQTHVRRYLTADVFYIAVGVNDAPLNNTSLTITHIRRLVALIRRVATERYGVAPFVIIATLLPTNRPDLSPFAQALTRQLLRQRSVALPVRVRFDGVTPHILGPDGLHPGAYGFGILEDILARYLRTPAQLEMASLRPDLDADGLYDQFEASKFGTDPALTDTDSDGLNDGDEIVTTLTDPLNPDSDGDTVLDGVDLFPNDPALS